jgi:hypothetical protein
MQEVWIVNLRTRLEKAIERNALGFGKSLMM